MPKKIPKTEAKEKIENFFSSLEDKTPKGIMKIKKIAMSNNIPLKEFRKKFCNKCFSQYKNPIIRIKNGIKSVKCEKCGKINRWKMK